MTEPMVDRRRWRPTLMQALVAVMVSNLLSTGLFVWAASNASNEAAKTAREENCEAVIEAFDKYTDALAKISNADPARVQLFRDAYEPSLRECH
jgi:hypothetical protein